MAERADPASWNESRLVARIILHVLGRVLICAVLLFMLDRFFYRDWYRIIGDGWMVSEKAPRDGSVHFLNYARTLDHRQYGNFKAWRHNGEYRIDIIEGPMYNRVFLREDEWRKEWLARNAEPGPGANVGIMHVTKFSDGDGFIIGAVEDGRHFVLIISRHEMKWFDSREAWAAYVRANTPLDPDRLYRAGSLLAQTRHAPWTAVWLLCAFIGVVVSLWPLVGAWRAHARQWRLSSDAELPNDDNRPRTFIM